MAKANRESQLTVYIGRGRGVLFVTTKAKNICTKWLEERSPRSRLEMHSASLKRGKLTARLGRLEALPGGPDRLKKEIAEKEEVLAKLCTLYEGLVTAHENNKKAVETSKKKLQILQNKSVDLEKTRKRLEAAAARSPPPTASSLRAKRDGAQLEAKDLQKKVEKARRKMVNMKRKKQKEEEDDRIRKLQKGKWESEEKELSEAIQKDGSQSQELEAFVARLSEALFERQRKYEEMLIGAHSGNIGDLDGIEKKLREERRRRMKERQLMEEKWPRDDEDDEKEGGTEKKQRNEGGKGLEEIGEKWIQTIDELLVSDVKLSEQEAIASAGAARINQIEAALRLLRMKKDPTMYTAYAAQKDETTRSREKRLPTEMGVKIPDFRRKIKEFIQRELAGQKGFLADETQDVDGSYWENLEDVQKENNRRRQMIQRGEDWARQKLSEELGGKMRIVEKFQQEVEAAESQANRNKKEIQAKKQELRNEEKKKESAERRRRQRKQDAEAARKKVDLVRRRKVEGHQGKIIELQQRRQEAEAKRKQIRGETTAAERETSNVRHLVRGLQTRLHDDSPELKKSAETYRTRVKELQGLEEELRKMLAEANRVNQQSKEQLEVVKPYEVEQQEMDSLLEQERQFDRQLKEAQKMQAADVAFP